MRRPNHDLRFAGIPKMKLQASGSSNRESLQFQNRQSVENRLSLNDFGRFSRATTLQKSELK
jgi:hypothetical protein